MPAVFEKLGIRFLYPENWTLDEGDALAGQQSVTVQSPGGAFWQIILLAKSVDPQEMAAMVLRAIKEEYEEFEAEPADQEIEKHELRGYDLNFYCLDLTNTALIRGFQLSEASCVILCQAEDREFADLVGE